MTSFDGWQRSTTAPGSVARAVFPTLLEPLPTREQLRELVGDDDAWEALFERPLGEAIEEAFDDDVLRGLVLTDALIGTFASAHDESLRQNRCFLYHVIGNGTGSWDVPVGGMGALTDELARCAAAAGAELVTGAEVDRDRRRRPARRGADRRPRGELRRTWWPAARRRCSTGCSACGSPDERPEGAQLKVNMLLARLPRLRDDSVPPEEAFTGTFHVNETYAQLEAAYARGERRPHAVPAAVRDLQPLADRPEHPRTGRERPHADAVRAAHAGAAVRAGRWARREVLAAALRSLDAVLAEPIEDCLLRGPDGQPCLEAKTPLDLEAELALPRGNIFHRDLAWPFAEDEGEAGALGNRDRHRQRPRSAARARAAAAASAASPAATRRWRSSAASSAYTGAVEAGGGGT